MRQTRIGVLGLGPAGLAMLPFIEAHPAFRLVALCDQRPEALVPFANTSDLTCVNALDALCAMPDLDAVFVATPTWLHCAHARAILGAGKHAIVEKPMALDRSEADAMVAEAKDNDRVLLIGHSQSFEPGIQIMRAMVQSGRLGPVRAINGWNYTDWMYRPRLPVEFDRTRGGGVVYRQAAHHIDMVRYILADSPTEVTATIGDWDPAKPGDGAYNALLRFPKDVTVSLFYSGYDHFPSTELTYGLGENGRVSAQGSGQARRQLRMVAEGSSPEKYGAGLTLTMERLEPGSGPACFGILIVSCERGDLRFCPEGVRVYGDDGELTIPIDGLPRGRQAVLDEFARGIAGKAIVHDGAWGRRNLETCLAMIASSEASKPITLAPETTPIPLVPDAVAARVEAAWSF